MSATAVDETSAVTYASWFATLADATRVQVLHAVATSPEPVAIGALARQVGIAQPTASHHVRLLADAGFVLLEKVGTSTLVTVNEACCTGLPHAADAVMGTLDTRPCCPDDVPTDVEVRALAEGEGPTASERWLTGHRWAAERDGVVVGWAGLSAVEVPGWDGVAEAAVHPAEPADHGGAGVALIDRLVRAADEDVALGTLQAHVAPEDRASLRLHHSAGFRTVGVREGVVRRDDGWHDLVLLERRRS